MIRKYLLLYTMIIIIAEAKQSIVKIVGVTSVR